MNETQSEILELEKCPKCSKPLPQKLSTGRLVCVKCGWTDRPKHKPINDVVSRVEINEKKPMAVSSDDTTQLNIKSISIKGGSISMKPMMLVLCISGSIIGSFTLLGIIFVIGTSLFGPPSEEQIIKDAVRLSNACYRYAASYEDTSGWPSTHCNVAYGKTKFISEYPEVTSQVSKEALQRWIAGIDPNTLVPTDVGKPLKVENRKN